MGDYLLLHVIGIFCAFFSLVSSDEVVAVGETREISFSPSIEAERIHIRGLPRFEHIDKYAYALKLTLKASSADDIHVCFHKDLTRAIGMCPFNGWKKVSNGSWIGTMSPFDHKILDVRAANSSTVVTLKVSILQEWLLFRIAFLLLGTLLVSSASTLSTSLAFYYAFAFSAGYILIALLLLNLLLRHLPSGRNPLGLFINSSLVALVGVVVYNSSSLYQYMLRLMGFDQGIEMVLKIILLWYVYLSGTLFAIRCIWGLVFTLDGSLDIRTAHFLSWSFWIIGALLILQSSVDFWLAGGALISVILVSTFVKKITKWLRLL